MSAVDEAKTIDVAVPDDADISGGELRNGCEEEACFTKRSGGASPVTARKAERKDSQDDCVSKLDVKYFATT